MTRIFQGKLLQPGAGSQQQVQLDCDLLSDPIINLDVSIDWLNESYCRDGKIEASI